MDTHWQYRIYQMVQWHSARGRALGWENPFLVFTYFWQKNAAKILKESGASRTHCTAHRVSVDGTLCAQGFNNFFYKQ